jgi:hypothetical protein
MSLAEVLTSIDKEIFRHQQARTILASLRVDAPARRALSQSEF